MPKDEENKNNVMSNYFTATYKTEEGQNIKAFNPLAVQVNDNGYYITINAQDNKTENLRNMDETQLEINLTNTSGGYFISPENGFINLKIYFLEELPSLDFLFYDCIDLIVVDLSHLNTTNISRISYTFYNCKNVEQINLTDLETAI